MWDACFTLPIGRLATPNARIAAAHTEGPPHLPHVYGQHRYGRRAQPPTPQCQFGDAVRLLSGRALFSLRRGEDSGAGASEELLRNFSTCRSKTANSFSRARSANFRFAGRRAGKVPLFPGLRYRVSCRFQAMLVAPDKRPLYGETRSVAIRLLCRHILKKRFQLPRATPGAWGTQRHSHAQHRRMGRPETLPRATPGAWGTQRHSHAQHRRMERPETPPRATPAHGAPRDTPTRNTGAWGTRQTRGAKMCLSGQI
jgi:hypothetical protein